MDKVRQSIIDKHLQKNKNRLASELLGPCKSLEEQVYISCALTQDLMRVFFNVIKQGVPKQEAKGAYKIALDTVLVDLGMSVVIHEFQ